MDQHCNIKFFILGDMKAFEELYRKYAGKAYNYVYSLTKDAELSKDITQNTFLQLWNSRNKIDGDGNIEGYIFAIARNLLYHEIRSRNVHKRYEEFVKDNSEEGEIALIDENISVKMIESRILSLLMELPESRRRIFLMRWSNGLSNKEIARELCISEKTVSTQIHRTVSFLKSKLGPIFGILCIILEVKI